MEEGESSSSIAWSNDDNDDGGGDMMRLRTTQIFPFTCIIHSTNGHSREDKVLLTVSNKISTLRL
jgi:hypothetical protein